MANSKKIGLFLATGFLCTFLAAQTVFAASLENLEIFWQNIFPFSQILPIPIPTLERQLLAKASPDECFNGIGNPPSPGPPCSQGVPKVNQAYVWGLTKSADKLWFGTAANVLCLVLGSLGIIGPHQTTPWACELGNSDIRAPRIYSFDTVSKILEDKTPATGPAGALLRTTLGIRSAGSLGNIVFLAGPSLVKGINIFAFNATTGNLIGATNILEFDDIRIWVVEKGILYTGVSNSAGGGSVLRWTGSLADPFKFEVVGNLDSEAAYLAVHEGRLFVSTWPPIRFGGEVLAGLYMSPLIPPGGLTKVHAGDWTKVWEVDDYEADPVTAATYGGGALASFNGYLYWGTMHVPGASLLNAIWAHENHLIDLDANGNGVLDGEEIVDTALGTYRPFSIFRGKNFGKPNQNIQLLYGQKYLPVYDATLKKYTFANDLVHSNRMPDPNPKWGKSGFGNFFNAYAWSMAVYKNTLFIGTFDWSYLLDQGFLDLVMGALITTGSISEIMDDISLLTKQFQMVPLSSYGADLYRVNGLLPATPESINGVGNFTNYGIRTMVADDALYLGMANPMNLLTNPRDRLPEGGWELIRLKRK